MIVIKLVIKQEDGEEQDRMFLVNDPSCGGRMDKKFILKEIEAMLEDFGDWVEGYFIVKDPLYK